MKLLIAALVGVFLIQTFLKEFDLSLLFGLVAIYLTFYEVRRDNSPLVSIRKCQYSFSQSTDVNNSQPFAYFEIVLRNDGVKLVNPFLKLRFRGPDGHGWASMPLQEFHEIHGQHQHFERGMIAVFGWKSYLFDEGDRHFLQGLLDAQKQDAFLVLYSQCYEACRFPVGDRTEALKVRWNTAILWIKRSCRRTILAEDGTKMEKTPDWLPMFQVLQPNVMHFVKQLGERPTKVTAETSQTLPRPPASSPAGTSPAAEPPA